MEYTGLVIFIAFIVGLIAERYLLPLADLVLQMFGNRRQLESTDVQLKINRINRTDKIEDAESELTYTEFKKQTNDILVEIKNPQTNLIGFNRDDEELEEYCDEEDDEDCDCDECREIDNRLFSDIDEYSKYELGKNRTIGFKKH